MALDSFLDGKLSGPDTDTVDAATKPIADPHGAIRSGTERDDFVVAQPGGVGEGFPVAGGVDKEAAGAARPDRAIGRLGNCPEARGGQFADAGKPAPRSGGDK